jgi:hypothetical protein
VRTKRLGGCKNSRPSTTSVIAERSAKMSGTRPHTFNPLPARRPLAAIYRLCADPMRSSALGWTEDRSAGEAGELPGGGVTLQPGLALRLQRAGDGLSDELDASQSQAAGCAAAVVRRAPIADTAMLAKTRIVVVVAAATIVVLAGGASWLWHAGGNTTWTPLFGTALRRSHSSPARPALNAIPRKRSFAHVTAQARDGSRNRQTDTATD